MINWLLGQDLAIRSTRSGMLGRIALVGMLMTPGEQCVYASCASSTTCGYISGSPPLIVNQYGAFPSEARTLSHSSMVSSSSRFIQMLQVRQRELHFGEGDSVRFNGNSCGHPNLRYILNRGIRAKMPAPDFISWGPLWNWLPSSVVSSSSQFPKSGDCAASCNRASRG